MKQGEAVETEMTVDERAAELKAWFMRLAEEESDAVVPKAAAYGAADLKIMGAALSLIVPGDWEPAAQLELGVAFYALGKVARLFGAYEQGKLPSDDTWYDLGIYARMAQRIRETGMWP